MRVAVGWFREGDRGKVAREVMGAISAMAGDRSPRAPAPSAKGILAEATKEVSGLKWFSDRIELVEKALGSIGGGPYSY